MALGSDKEAILQLNDVSELGILKRIVTYIQLRDKIEGRQSSENKVITDDVVLGLCHGYSVFKSLARIISEEQKSRDGPIGESDNLEFFNKVHDTLSNWNAVTLPMKPSEDPPVIDYDAELVPGGATLNEVERFIGIVRLMQSEPPELEKEAKQAGENVEQENLARRLELLRSTSSDPTKPKHEFYISGLLTSIQLKQVLAQTVHQGRITIVSNYEHATGITKIGDEYFFIDSSSDDYDVRSRTLISNRPLTLEEASAHIFGNLYDEGYYAKEGFSAPNDRMVSPFMINTYNVASDQSSYSYPKASALRDQEFTPPTPEGYPIIFMSLLHDDDATFRHNLNLSDPNVNIQLHSRNVDKNTPLMLAIAFGKITKAKIILDHPKLDINKRNKNNRVALDFACEYGNLEIVKGLVRMGADVNHYEPPSGMPAIYYAIKNNKGDTTKFLLSQGSAIDYIDSNGNTLLHHAIYNGDRELVEQLIKQGINIDHKNNQGESALVVAAGEGHHMIVDDLIAAARSTGDTMRLSRFINDSDNKGRTALFRAVQNGYIETLMILQRGNAQINIADLDSVTPLYAAYQASTGSADMVRELELAQAKLVIGDRRDKADLLRYAAMKGDLKMIINLVENHNGQQFINDANQEGETALLLACKNKNLSVVKYLLQNGAEKVINQPNGAQNDYPLYSAAESGELDILKELITANAIVSMDAQYVGTALIGAVANEQFDVVCFLLANAGSSIVNKSHAMGAQIVTPLAMAVSMGNIRIVDELLKAGAIIGAEIKNSNITTTISHVAAKQGNIDIFRKLVERGADPNKRDDNGQSPLYAAIAKNRVDVFTELIEKHGSEINTSDKYGQTPLDVAIEHKNLYIVKELIYRGALLTSHGKEGNNALHKAILANDLNLVKLILDHNKNLINSTNNDGVFPMELAIKMGNIEIFKELCKFGKPSPTNPKSDKYLHIAAQHGRLEILDILVSDYRYNSNYITGDQLSTPLYCAVLSGNSRVVESLIASGASVDLPVQTGETPLILAAALGKIDIFNTLLANGANINFSYRDADNSAYKSVLFCAAQFGHTEIVQQLIDIGVQFDERIMNLPLSTNVRAQLQGYQQQINPTQMYQVNTIAQIPFSGTPFFDMYQPRFDNIMQYHAKLYGMVSGYTAPSTFGYLRSVRTTKSNQQRIEELKAIDVALKDINNIGDDENRNQKIKAIIDNLENKLGKDFSTSVSIPEEGPTFKPKK